MRPDVDELIWGGDAESFHISHDVTPGDAINAAWRRVAEETL